jgi:hypothetical protein
MKRTSTALIPASWAGVARPCAYAGSAWHLMTLQVNAKRQAVTAFPDWLPRQPT